MTNSKKLFVSLVVMAAAFAAGAALAQETTTAADISQEINLDENIQAQDLGIAEPRILPDSPFYFLKNWARGIQQTITLDPVKKAELKLKIASEKLLEVRKTAEKTNNPEIIKKAAENYQQEIEKIKTQADKIKDKADQNEEVGNFLDKFIKQQVLQQRILEKLESQVPSEVLAKIKATREEHLQKFGEVMTRLENKDKIPERLEKNLEEISGSQFKNFKSLEILKDLEEKVPEEAKEAIQEVQGNTLKKLQGDLEKMSPENQEKFKEYLGKIGGEKEKQLEILEDLKSNVKLSPETQTTPEFKGILEKELEQGKTKILDKIKKGLEKLNCPVWPISEEGFCKKGRVVVKKDPETGCPLPPKCVLPADLQCEISVTCIEGYYPMSTGEKVGECPVMKCVKEKESEKPYRVCISSWNPICGKDGKTYTNSCFAELAGAEIVYEGACEEVASKLYCRKDADCACGVKKSTQECFYGNKEYVDESFQCPDFCSGFGGNLLIRCIKNKCQQATK